MGLLDNALFGRAFGGPDDRAIFQKTVDGYEATWVQKPPERFGIEDGFSWAYDLTNNTGEHLDSAGQYVSTSVNGFTLGPVQVAPGETTRVSGSIDDFHILDALGLASPGTRDVTFGVAGPADIFTVEMEAVEGSLDDSPPPDPDLVTVSDCSISPRDIVEDDVVSLVATVENDNDDPVNAQVRWGIGLWGWSETFQVAAGKTVEVELQVPFDSINISRVGGFGDYNPTVDVALV